MSKIVARMQKMKAGNLTGAYCHNERIFENHANKDIDTEKSGMNYELTGRDRELTYKEQIESYIEENKISKRATRKDAVLCDEWVITSDQEFFQQLNEVQTREFFESAKDYFAENYGLENIAYASVHLDETTPHMHMGVVPMQDGRLSSKAMFDREELKKIQEELPAYLKERGFDIERGAENSQAKHLTVAEYKQELAGKELENELKELGAPDYISENGVMIPDEVKQEFYPDRDFEKASLKDKVQWIKEKVEGYQEWKDGLDERISGLEAEQGYYTEEIIKSRQELSESRQELSESRQELSESRQELSEVKTELKELKPKADRLKEIAENSKKFDELWHEQKGVIGKEKKGLFGKKEMHFTAEEYEFLKSKMELIHTDKRAAEALNSKLQTEVSDLKRLNGQFRDRNIDLRQQLERTEKTLDGVIQDNKYLHKKLDYTSRKLGEWRKKTRDLMPKKEFKKLSKAIDKGVRMQLNLTRKLMPSAKIVTTVAKKFIEKVIG